MDAEKRNNLVEKIMSLVATAEMRAKKCTMPRHAIENGVDLMIKHPGIHSLDIRAGGRVAQSFSEAHRPFGRRK